MLTSFNPSRKLSVCGSNPTTTRPRPRLSALVSACKRVNVSGKRSRPTVPARKNNAPAETARIVTMSRAMLITCQWFGGSRSQVGSSLLDEGDGREGGQERERQRDVDRSRHAGHCPEQQQGRNAPSSDQLRRHHAIGRS